MANQAHGTDVREHTGQASQTTDIDSSTRIHVLDLYSFVLKTAAVGNKLYHQTTVLEYRDIRMQVLAGKAAELK